MVSIGNPYPAAKWGRWVGADSKLGETRRMKMNYNFAFEVGTLEKH
jgi:hypothetical protein